MKIGKLWIGFDRAEEVDVEAYKTIDADYEAELHSGKRLILGTLAARSGTRTLCNIFEAHKNATGITERNAGAESFYRYITYNKLPIDTAGIITLIKKGVLDDWNRGDVALVFSPYFSHGIKELYNSLRPEKVMLAINDPEFTVQSMYNKELFLHQYFRDRVDYALGFQPELMDRWSHFFGRIVPNGEFYNTWLKLTRLGKLAWWGNRITVDIYKQLQALPEEKVFIFHPTEADQDYYGYYKKLVATFGLTPLLKEKELVSLRAKTFKKAHNVKHEWDAQEREEFEYYTKEWHDIYQKLCG